MKKDDLKLINNVLKGKSKEELVDLILSLCKHLPDSVEYILEWENESDYSSEYNKAININDELALKYWEKAEDIICEFNEYGGGDVDDETEAIDYLEKIEELSSKLSWNARKEIIDGMLIQFNNNNSGLEDTLSDTFFNLCRVEDEWIYLANELLKAGSSWNENLAMRIYKIINHDKEFLEIRKSSLIYGLDYYDLVEFYEEKNDRDNALYYAQEGLLKGEGRISDLLKYLLNQYEKINDSTSLENIMSVCEKRQQDQDIAAEGLFEYYKKINNYEKAKEYLLKYFKYAKSDLYDIYVKVQRYLKKLDWDKVEKDLFSSVKNRNIEDYLKICLDKNMNDEVIEIIFNKVNLWNDYSYFADKLDAKYPEKISEYYIQLGNRTAQRRLNRKSYRESMKYFLKVKRIYSNILYDETGWQKKLLEIKNLYKNKPAFLDEAKVLDK